MARDTKKTKGIGDLVSTVTKAIGLEECNNCEKRKEWLNVNFPFGRPTPLTDEQKQRIETEPLQVYNEAFGTNIGEAVFTGGVKTSIIKKLNKLLEYEN